MMTPTRAGATIDGADPGHRAVLAVGPGLGPGDWQRALVMRLLTGRRAVVLDADGLNALAASLEAPSDAAMDACGSGEQAPVRILTPHPGEFRRLAKPLGITLDPTDPAQRPAAAAALVNALHDAGLGLGNTVVLLKGQHTVISDGRRYARNTTGNPAPRHRRIGRCLDGAHRRAAGARHARLRRRAPRRPPPRPRRGPVGPRARPSRAPAHSTSRTNSPVR